jgi:ABC-type iron transport system FetAB permease component
MLINNKKCLEIFETILEFVLHIDNYKFIICTFIIFYLKYTYNVLHRCYKKITDIIIREFVELTISSENYPN